MHSFDPGKFIGIERRLVSYENANRFIANQKNNLLSIAEAGIECRINIVVNESVGGIINYLLKLFNFCEGKNIEIRLLNNLNDTEKSQHTIKDVLSRLGASKINKTQKNGSSNYTCKYKLSNGQFLTTKISHQYYLNEICDHCHKKVFCKEGFYGMRLERRKNGYCVRLCIYRNDEEVLMPWREFILSRQAEGIKKLIK